MEVIDQIIYWAEIIGTIAFALSGAMVGIEKRFDIFGIIVLATSTAVGGGAIRDVMIGRTPPNMFVQPVYASLAIISAIIVFAFTYNMKYFSRYRKQYFFLVEVFDTIGLGAFAITASNLILELYPDANILLTCFMAFLTGAGGGILRDMMAGRVSVVLRKRIYAVAAIVGSAMYYYLYDTSLNKSVSMILCIVLVIIIRMLAARYHWNLPKPSEDYFRVMEAEVIAKQHWEQTADPEAVKLVEAGEAILHEDEVTEETNNRNQ